MSWRERPNASHFSARYAERKMAARRARLEQPVQAMKCDRVGCDTMITRDFLCPPCRAEVERLRDLKQYEAADAFVLGGPRR